MILLVVIPMLLLFSVYYIYVSGELMQSKKEEMDKVLHMEQEYLISFFDTRKLEVEYLSQRTDVQNYLTAYLNSDGNMNAELERMRDDLCSKFVDMNADSEEIQDVFILGYDGLLVAGGNSNSYWIDLSSREYFNNAMDGKTTMSNLLKDVVDGRHVIFVSTPVYNMEHEEVVGALVTLIDMEETSKSITNITDPNSGDAYIVDFDGNIVFHKDATKIGNRPDNELISLFMKSEEFQKDFGNQIIENGLKNVYLVFQTVDDLEWKIVLEQDMNVLMQSAYQALFVMIVVLIITITIAFAVSLKLSRNITFPLTELTKITNLAKEGNLFSRFSYNGKNEYGQLAYSFNTMLDELHATEEELRINNDDLEDNKRKLEEAQIRYNMALESARDVVWEWNLISQEFYVSDHWKALFMDVIAEGVVEIVAFEQVLDAENIVLFQKEIENLIEQKGELMMFTFSYHQADGTIIWCQIKASSVLDESNNVVKLTGTLSDYTLQKEAEDRIWELAFVDQLTHLPNRTAFKYKLEEKIKEAETTGEQLGLFLLDLDNFKRVNDTLGHDVGDLLIVEVANRLREIDVTVFFLAGDEFAVIIRGKEMSSMIEEHSKKIHELFMSPFFIHERTIMLSVSMGASVFPEDGKSWGKLVQNADTALFIAKDEGKSKTVFFNKLMSEKVMRKLEIETIVRRAIKDGLVQMYYQPQYCPKTSELTSFEALMRMKLEDGTMISPGEFIPVAEEIGAIIELGTWALQEVCKQIYVWMRNGFSFDYISVNVSGVQLRQSDFAEIVQKIAEDENVSPEKIELELTESTFMDTSDKKMTILSKLKGSGFRIALDDFGTGYSSFQYLRTLPITTLKIDKSFVDTLLQSKKSEFIVRQIIEIGHDIELRVVAEGVETKEQKEILENLSCDLIQGYFYSKPLSKLQTENMLIHRIKTNN